MTLISRHTHTPAPPPRVQTARQTRTATPDLPALTPGAWKLRGLAADCDARRQSGLAADLRRWADQLDRQPALAAAALLEQLESETLSVWVRGLVRGTLTAAR